MNLIPQDGVGEWIIYYYSYFTLESLVVVNKKTKLEIETELIKEIDRIFDIKIENSLEEFKSEASKDRKFRAYKKNDRKIIIYRTFWFSLKPVAKFILRYYVNPLTLKNSVQSKQNFELSRKFTKSKKKYLNQKEEYSFDPIEEQTIELKNNFLSSYLKTFQNWIFSFFKFTVN